MSQSIFNRMSEILTRAHPVLCEVPWNEYGKSIQQMDGEVRKYQSFMLLYSSGSSGITAQASFGSIPDDKKSLKTVMNKLVALNCNPNFMASVELRDPPHVWGGGLRDQESDANLWGITGLPEVVDHLVVTHALYYCGAINGLYSGYVLSNRHPGLANALMAVDMSEEDYEKLTQVTREIILAAAM